MSMSTLPTAPDRTASCAARAGAARPSTREPLLLNARSCTRSATTLPQTTTPGGDRPIVGLAVGFRLDRHHPAVRPIACAVTAPGGQRSHRLTIAAAAPSAQRLQPDVGWRLPGGRRGSPE